MKTIIIKSAKDSFEQTINRGFFEYGVDVLSIESIVKEKKGIRKIFNILTAVLSIKKKTNNKVRVIVFDDTTFYLISVVILKNCYLWLWNTLPKTKGNMIKLPLCRIWNRVYSFDDEECKRYKIKKNTQFICCFPKLNCKIKNDVYYVGTDKGRYEQIKMIYEYCTENEISSLIQIVPDKGKEYNHKLITDRFVDYEEVLTHIAESKAVLDLCKHGQFGTTYRLMEALYYDKKIITNNPLYRNLGVFSTGMIYIIDEENMNGLKKFIQKKSCGYDEKYKELYSIKNWLERFE